MANTKKQSQVSALEQLLRDNSHFAVFMYEKVPHTALEALRKELRKNESRLKVIKNTLFRKALRHLGTADKKISDLDKNLKEFVGNSALVTFGKDWSAGLSTFGTFADREKGLSFKFGFLDQELYLKEDLEKIAKLPSKPLLMGQLIGTMKSPLSHLTYAMKFNTQKLVYILTEKSKQTS